METELEIQMERVSIALFWEHLNRWRMITSVSQEKVFKNSDGFYSQTGYFSVAEVVGTKLIPDMTNILGAIRRSPRGEMAYFINTNATPEQ